MENQTIGMKERWIAVSTLIASVASVISFSICRAIGFEFLAIGFATFGFGVSSIWAPALVYAGIRTKSSTDVMCGLIAALTTVYWFWLLASS